MLGKKCLTFLLLIMLTLPIMSVFVSASPSKITYAGQSFNGELDNKYVQLSNGRAVYAFIDSATPTYLRIKVINSDGSVYGTVDYLLASKTLLDCTVYYVSDTVVYIGIVYYYTGGYKMYSMVKFNPSALTSGPLISCTAINMGNSATYINAAYLTSIITYNSKLYFMSSEQYFLAPSSRTDVVYLMEYVPDTTLTATYIQSSATGSISSPYPIYWFNYSAGIAYAVIADSTTPLSYYTVNLVSKTTTILVAHNTPSDMVDRVTAQYSHFLGGGLISNGTDKYLYFTWIRPHQITAVNYITYMQERLIFNATVSTAQFTGYSRSVLGITLDYSGYSTPTWCLGYSVSKSQFKLFYPNINSGLPTMNRIIINISDWFDTASLTYTLLVGTSESLPDSINEIYPVSQSFITQWGLAVDNTGIVIMYRLASLINVYTVVGVISPADSPLIQNKQYYLALTGKVNGLGRGGLAVSITINSGIPIIYGLSSTGTLNEPIKFTSTGLLTIIINLIDIRIDTSTVATQTLTNVVQAEPTAPVGGIGGLIYNMQDSLLNTIINFAPSAVVIFAPAGLMGVVMGPIGFIAGALIGVVLGVQASLFPMYVLYLVFLILGLLTLMILRGGSQ